MKAPEAKAPPTRVVVLGGGFGGVYTAQALTALLRRRKDVEVELLSEENFFVFQPLLPEVAAGGISPSHVVNPIRELVPRARFRCCVVQSVDLANKRVLVSQGEGLELVAVPYDHLVFCLGKVTNFSNMPGVSEHALAMKDVADAMRLRNHVVRCLELADIEGNPEAKRALLTFVVAGGGFSGVETVGELRELVSRTLEYFPRIRPEEVRFKLVHSQKTVLPEMPPRLGATAQRVLEARGVEMLLGVRLRAASRDHVYLEDGTVIPARTFVCTMGNGPNPIVRATLSEGGFTEAQVNGKKLGTFETDATLQCVGRPGYWAVGDCAAVPNPGGGYSPPTAQFATRQAKVCALNIVAAIDGTAPTPFAFKALGILASLGSRSAVAEVFGVQLTGFLAWFMWRTIYLSKLPGLARKVRVALDWTLDLFFARDITQLQAIREEPMAVQHYEQGEVIVQAGQIGREFFIILSGEVEVIDDDGTKLASLKRREVFGEKALLNDVRRTATVRATSPVDVLVMSRGDFRSMVKSFPVLDDYFTKLLSDRVERPPEVASSK